MYFRSNILVTFWTYRSLQLRPGLQFVVVMHRPHLQTSLSCRRSFGLQDRANLVPEYIFFRLKPIHKTSFEDITTFLFKGSQFFEAIFLTTRNRNLVVWSSCCFRYEIQLGSELGQLFGTDMFHSSSREIYHRLSQQTRQFQWICTYIRKTVW